jgi:hypothetical protein
MVERGELQIVGCGLGSALSLGLGPSSARLGLEPGLVVGQSLKFARAGTSRKP